MVGRLIYVQDASPEQANEHARHARGAATRRARVYFRARRASLPAYLPTVALGALTFLAASRLTIPGALLIAALLIWLTLSALPYAHLIVVQIYVAAERELERRGLARVRELV
jgi:hypothetical protein